MASATLYFVVSKSITGNMDSSHERMETVKGCRVTPFLSELRRTFTIFLPITWKRMRLSYLEGYRDSSEIMLKYCPRMKQRLVSGACTTIPVKLLVNKQYVTVNLQTCGNSSIQMLLCQNQCLTFALPVNKTRLNFCAQQTYPSKKNRTVLEPSKITWTVHSVRGNFIETLVRSQQVLSSAWKPRQTSTKAAKLVLLMAPCTTHLITHSRSTFQAIQCSRVPFISRLPESVASLECPAKQFPVKLFNRRGWRCWERS